MEVTAVLFFCQCANHKANSGFTLILTGNGSPRLILNLQKLKPRLDASHEQHPALHTFTPYSCKGKQGLCRHKFSFSVFGLKRNLLLILSLSYIIS